jgi:hypothetical protein
MNVNFLGELALDPEVRIGGDSGNPVAARDSQPFMELARAMVERIEQVGPQKGPSIEVTE